MADQVFNVALGRVRQYYDQVQGNNPAASGLYVIAINANGATDDTIQDYDTLSALLGDANVAEVTNTGYSRKEVTDSDLSAASPDDANNRLDLDMPDQTWSAVQSGDAWTDLVVCYVPDLATPSGDGSIIPLTLHDFAVTPDGTDITATVNASGFFRAS